MGRINLVHNPRFHANVTDGWAAAPAGMTITRVTSVPGASLPAGADAAAKIVVGAGENRLWYWESDPVALSSLGYVVWGFSACAQRVQAETSFGVDLAFYDGADALIEAGGGYVGYPVAGEFCTQEGYLGGSIIPEGAASFRLRVVYGAGVGGAAQAETLYITQFQAEWGETLAPYGDGSTDGWVWDGDAHNSASHQVRFVPRARRPFGAGFSLKVTSPGGRSVDLSDRAEGFSCSAVEWGGYDTAQWDMHVSPYSFYEELSPLGDVVATYDGETIFEGRLTDIGKELTGGDGCVRRMTARGYFDTLKDDETYQCCFVDQDLSRWEDLALSRVAFGTVTGQDDVVRINVLEEQKYVTGASCKVVYQLLGGAAPSGDSIHGFVCTIVDTIFGSGWEVDLITRATPQGANIAVVWSSTGTGTYNLSLDESELDPASTGNVRCLVLRVKYTGVPTFSFVGMDPDNPFGVELTASRVKASNAASMAPEDIVRDLVSDVTTAAQRDFPDATGFVVGQLVFDSPCTKLEAIEQVNELVRWQYGFGPGGVFTYRQPWEFELTPLCPDRSRYDIPYSDASPSLSYDFSGCYNAVVVRYTNKRGLAKTYRSTSSSNALGTLTRTASIDAPEGIHDAAGAAQVGTVFLRDNSEPVITGTVPLQGMVKLADGRERAALHVKCGEWVCFRDSPPEEQRGRRINRVDIDIDSLTLTASFGRESHFFDRMVARMDLRMKRRRRR